MIKDRVIFQEIFRRLVMWKGLSVLLPVIFSFWLTPAFVVAQEEMARAGEAAKVNGVVITNEAVAKQMRSMQDKKERSETPAELRQKALDGLIFQELAWQRAKADGLTVEQATIDEALEKIKTNYGGESGFREFLGQNSLTEEGLREVLVKSYTLKLLIEREVSQKVTVTGDDLKQAYEKDKEKYLKPEKLTVIDVLFFLKTDDAESVRKAEEVLKKIQADEQKNPMVLVPDGTFIVREMELTKEEPELYQEAKKLKFGEVSGVIKASDSLHIIKVKEYVPERQKTLDEVRRSIDVKLIAEERKKRMQAFEAELKNGAKIEIINANSSEK